MPVLHRAMQIVIIIACISATSASNDNPVPLKEIMKGVVFSLSGYKNPKRSDLREKGIEMGARYKPDWDSTCTHLICAYDNTPKFGQVMK